MVMQGVQKDLGQFILSKISWLYNYADFLISKLFYLFSRSNQRVPFTSAIVCKITSCPKNLKLS